jgi:murein DD-endopeptidase MepM/ murein hydrolase activator NlpD
MNKVKDIAVKLMSNKKQLLILILVLLFLYITQFAMTVLYVNYRPGFLKVKGTPEQVADLTKEVREGFGYMYKWTKAQDSINKITKITLEHLPTGAPLELNGRNRISSSFGIRTNPLTGNKEAHKAIDIRAPKGTPVFAMASGQVDQAGQYRGYGNKVRYRCGNGYTVTYAHLDSIFVTTGELITQGEEIGTIGRTGDATGTHVHIEISFSVNGKEININPAVFL